MFNVVKTHLKPVYDGLKGRKKKTLIVIIRLNSSTFIGCDLSLQSLHFFHTLTTNKVNIGLISTLPSLKLIHILVMSALTKHKLSFKIVTFLISF